MMKIKTAQFSQPPADFTNGDVRRVLSALHFVSISCQKKLQLIEQINSEIDNIKSQGQLQISLQDIQQDEGLWRGITEVLGDDHWSLDPNKGIV